MVERLGMVMTPWVKYFSQHVSSRHGDHPSYPVLLTKRSPGFRGLGLWWGYSQAPILAGRLIDALGIINDRCICTVGRYSSTMVSGTRIGHY